ncbi:MAG TPA: sigma 54-interacting transcriptional regulator [Negativicutes bacterium]
MKIVIIAPMKEIIDTVNEMRAKGSIARFGEVEVVLGDLENGLEEACRAVERGADVIISRGGTASLIAKNVEIPVVEIQVSAFDILRALKQVNNADVIGFAFVRRLLFECEKLGDLMGLRIREIFMENETIEEKLIAAYRDGVSSFIGDASSVRKLKQLGIKATPIESSEDAIKQALIEAENLAVVRRREQEKAELFRTIINASTDGIIAINKDGIINVLNPVAENVFQIDSSLVIGKYIGDLIPDDILRDCLVSDEFEQEGVKNVGNKMFAIKRLPITLHGEVIGAVANIEDVTQLQNFEQVVRQKLNKKGLVAKVNLNQLLGSSGAMREIKERACQYANTDATVLITGESGTGKEGIAQSIHNLSQRKNGPFVAVNCAALPESLLESELFGYEEGAFTGAKKGGKAGLFEMAHRGTIFLDEIGEIPLPLQARLLRVLQEREIMRIGSDSVIPVDVRVLAATNQDLMALVDIKQFRADLYYRIDVLRLHLPPLRDRIKDIPELVQATIKKIASKNNRVYRITDNAMTFLQLQPWKGNIRELENVIERVVLISKSGIIDEGELRREFPDYQRVEDEDCINDLEKLEKQKIEQILLEEKYNYSQAAKKLGISRTTLWRKIRELKSK